MSDEPMLFDGKPCTVVYAKGSSLRIIPQGGKPRTVDASRVKPARSASLPVLEIPVIHGGATRPGKAAALASMVADGTLVRASELRAVPKEKPHRSAPYREYVRSRPCCVPGCTTPQDRVEAHHFGRHGMSTKTDDARCVPLCHEHHHGQWHRHGLIRPMTREETVALFLRVQTEILTAWLAEHGHTEVDVLERIVGALVGAVREERAHG